MRVARASEPDVALRVGGLGGDLGERLARALQGEGDADARLALELVGDGLAPLGLDPAVDVEATLEARTAGGATSTTAARSTTGVSNRDARAINRPPPSPWIRGRGILPHGRMAMTLEEVRDRMKAARV